MSATLPAPARALPRRAIDARLRTSRAINLCKFAEASGIARRDTESKRARRVSETRHSLAQSDRQPQKPGDAPITIATRLAARYLSGDVRGPIAHFAGGARPPLEHVFWNSAPHAAAVRGISVGADGGRYLVSPSPIKGIECGTPYIDGRPSTACAASAATFSISSAERAIR